MVKKKGRSDTSSFNIELYLIIYYDKQGKGQNRGCPFSSGME